MLSPKSSPQERIRTLLKALELVRNIFLSRIYNTRMIPNFFLDGDDNQLRKLIFIIHFSNSGMKINSQKKCLVGLNSPSQGILEISKLLQCPIHTFSVDYLGVPLRGYLRQRGFWLPVFERVKRKLATWKAKYLSFGGWITLIISALSNLPIYFISIFKIAKAITLEIKTLRNQFLWRGNSESKPHLINWEIVARPKAMGI